VPRLGLHDPGAIGLVVRPDWRSSPERQVHRGRQRHYLPFQRSQRGFGRREHADGPGLCFEDQLCRRRDHPLHLRQRRMRPRDLLSTEQDRDQRRLLHHSRLSVRRHQPELLGHSVACQAVCRERPRQSAAEPDLQQHRDERHRHWRARLDHHRREQSAGPECRKHPRHHPAADRRLKHGHDRARRQCPTGRIVPARRRDVELRLHEPDPEPGRRWQLHLRQDYRDRAEWLFDDL